MAGVWSARGQTEEESRVNQVRNQRRILLSVHGASKQEKKHDRGKDCGNHAAPMCLVHRHSSSIASQRIFLAPDEQAAKMTKEKRRRSRSWSVSNLRKRATIIRLRGKRKKRKREKNSFDNPSSKTGGS